jgi:ABC-2 type transport system ATP-binding protein
VAVIELRDLTKRFGGLVAVDHLSFEVESGRVVGFLGPNGAGKTTTLRMLLGLAAPTEGSATINGRLYHELDQPLHIVGAVLDASEATRGELPGIISASRRYSAKSARRESIRCSTSST